MPHMLHRMNMAEGISADGTVRAAVRASGTPEQRLGSHAPEAVRLRRCSRISSQDRRAGCTPRVERPELTSHTGRKASETASSPVPLQYRDRATGGRRMNRPAFLALTAAAGALSLGLLAVNFGSVAPQAAAQATPAARPPRTCPPRRRRPTSWTPGRPSWPRSRRSSVRSPRSNSRRNSPSGGRTSRAGPTCATASSSATSSPSRSRRP